VKIILDHRWGNLNAGSAPSILLLSTHLKTWRSPIPKTLPLYGGKRCFCSFAACYTFSPALGSFRYFSGTFRPRLKYTRRKLPNNSEWVLHRVRSARKKGFTLQTIKNPLKTRETRSISGSFLFSPPPLHTQFEFSATKGEGHASLFRLGWWFLSLKNQSHPPLPHTWVEGATKHWII